MNANVLLALANGCIYLENVYVCHLTLHYDASALTLLSLSLSLHVRTS